MRTALVAFAISCFVLAVVAGRFSKRLHETRIVQHLTSSNVWWHAGEGDFIDKLLGTGPIITLTYGGQKQTHAVVGIDDLRGLSELTDLRKVYFEGMEMQPEVLTLLTKLPVLEQLDLAYTNIDDSATPVLCQMKQLKLLRLTNVPLSDESKVNIYQALPDTLVVLDPGPWSRMLQAPE